MLWWWWPEKLDQISSGKQVELQQSEYSLLGTSQFGFEIEGGDQQIDAQGDPNLGQHCVAGCSQNGFDFQVLFDPLEKLFDFPAFFVNIGDLFGFKVMCICDKPIFDTGFQIGVVDQAKRLLNSLEADRLVLGDAGAFSSGPFEQIYRVVKPTVGMVQLY